MREIRKVINEVEDIMSDRLAVLEEQDNLSGLIYTYDNKLDCLDFLNKLTRDFLNPKKFIYVDQEKGRDEDNLCMK